VGPGQTPGSDAVLGNRFQPPEAGWPVQRAINLEEEIYDEDTGGNFRLIEGLMTQIARVMTINQLHAIAPEIVHAARDARRGHPVGQILWRM